MEELLRVIDRDGVTVEPLRSTTVMECFLGDFKTKVLRCFFGEGAETERLM